MKKILIIKQARETKNKVFRFRASADIKRFNPPRLTAESDEHSKSRIQSLLWGLIPFISLLLLISFGAIFVPPSVYAQDKTAAETPQLQEKETPPAFYKGILRGKGPITPQQAAKSILPGIVDNFSLFVIGVSVLFVIVAGFNLILARGEPEKISTAKQSIVWLIVGVFLV
ncbi:MAG TPA: hypothetical protein ENI70_02025, partial [Candidatus Peregrinibacteria bacterium]|nr:hypothetical protein [Candidatus Peregrinibacteria bacterium]